MKMQNEFNVSLMLRLISSVLLFLAIGNHPYSYFIVLRWIVFLSSLYSGWLVSKMQQHNWSWIFFIVGILFNPIFPVYLDRSTWQIIDIIVAVIFIASLIKNYRK